MSYSAQSIEVLPPLEAVRRRPAMYIGSSGPAGVHQLVIELVQNAVDEVLAGACSHIQVFLGSDAIVVDDDGRGIPVEAMPDGRSALEVVLTELHAGGKFRSGAYEAPGGLHGVGLSCVNALSSRLEVDVFRNGEHWQMVCGQGRVLQSPTRIGPSTRTGTRLSFQPDPQIFVDGATADPAFFEQYLQEQAFLQPGLRTTLQVGDRSQSWSSHEGLPGFVKFLSQDLAKIHPDPILVTGEQDGIRLEAVLLWTTGYGEHIKTFVNRVRTPQGGAHLDGLGAALTRVLHQQALALKMIEPEEAWLLGSDLREGLVGVLAIRMAEPEFEGQTKLLLTSSVAGPVSAILIRGLTKIFGDDPELTRRIVGKTLEAGRARLAARRAGERARYRSLDSVVSKEVYRQQFGIRSKNWHQSARWLTDEGLLGTHAAACAVSPEAEVLDICCGSGVVGASFRGKVKKITGLDLTPQMVELAKTRLDEVVQGDVYAIPFPENRFDLVVNREVLHLLPEPQRPVAEVFRVLKPGAQFIVGQMVPYNAADAAWFFRVVKKKQPLFFNNLMEEDMIRLLSGAGFENITTAEYLQWEDIDLWIDTWETPNQLRHEIRDLYHHAPAEVRAVHPFRISPEGKILDQWRWVIFSAFKPA